MLKQVHTISYILCRFTYNLGSIVDYTLNTGQVRAFYRSPDPPDILTLNFRQDHIAQEPNETLSLSLSQKPGTTPLPTGDGVFFRSSINITIIDSDSKKSGS